MAGDTIYLLSSGEYSSYQVHAASDDGELIRKMVESREPISRFAAYEYEEVPWLHEMPTLYIVRRMGARIDSEGVVSGAYDHGYSFWPFEYPASYLSTSPAKAEVRKLGSTFTLDVSGTDRQKVAKVYGEKLARLQSELMGI